MFSFVRKLPTCLPEWLYRFASPQAINESPCGSSLSPAFGVVNSGLGSFY